MVRRRRGAPISPRSSRATPGCSATSTRPRCSARKATAPAPGDSLDATAVAAAVPVGARLVFSMGCHSGSERPGHGPSGDRRGLRPGTCRARRRARRQTGFGYGDAVTPGAGERLMIEFARGLDGRSNIGRALIFAKQRYFADSGLYGPYDEKVLGETTFYGIPLYRTAPGPTAPDPAEATPDPVVGTSLHAEDLTLDPTFTEVDDRPRSTTSPSTGRAGARTRRSPPANRPVQPRLDVDVTAANGTNLRPAHGVLVTDLGSTTTPRPSTRSSAVRTWGPRRTNPRPVGPTWCSPPRSPRCDVLGSVGPPERARSCRSANRWWCARPVPLRLRPSEQRLYGHLGIRVFYSSSTDYAPVHPGGVEFDVGPRAPPSRSARSTARSPPGGGALARR